jgi:arginase
MMVTNMMTTKDMETAMSKWTMIGVPSSAGAHHAGQDLAPQALRQAGLVDRARAAGVDIEDAGDLPGAVFAVDHEHPRARNLDAVVRVAGEVADAVAGHLDSGRLPLVVGGDCTITLGVIAGFQRYYPDVGLVYVDGEADLGTPDSDSAGIFDAMGVAHLLGGGAPELAGLAGTTPLLAARRLALVGGDPRETNEKSRAFLAETGVSFQEGPALIADPVAVAECALAAVAPASGPVVVHFDVDTVDSGDLPLGNFPSYGSGLLLEHVVPCLRALRAHPSFAGLILTEVNPTYDPAGSQLDRYVDAIVTVLAG